MKKKRSLLIALGLALILAIHGFTGCNGTADVQTSVPPQNSQPTASGEPRDELDGSQWKLVSINDSPLVVDSYISLYFSGGAYWGSAGLNTYSGKYTVNDSALAFSDSFTTLIGGPEDITHQEEAYFKYFSGMVSHHLDGDRLEISNNNITQPLVFERLPEYAMNPSDLIGTRWQLVFLDGEPMVAGLSAILEFEDGSRATAQAGSLVDWIDYETNGDTIHLLGISGTNLSVYGKNSSDIVFTPDPDGQAGRFTGWLAFMANYRRSQNKLEIFTIQGKTLVFQPAADTDSTSPISILPSPGSYLTNSDNVSSEALLKDVHLVQGISDKQYNPPWQQEDKVDIGESILVVSGSIQNKHEQNKEIALYAQGYDDTGKQVAWTLDAAHIAGQIGLHLEKEEIGQFTLHLNMTDNVKSIRIFANNYNVAPP